MDSRQKLSVYLAIVYILFCIMCAVCCILCVLVFAYDCTFYGFDIQVAAG